MPEILLVLAVILIFFGAKKLPELAKGMGQGIKEFKKATRDATDEMERAMDDPPLTPPRPPLKSPSKPAAMSLKKTPDPLALRATWV